MVPLTQVAMEKNEKAMVACAASWGIPLVSLVRAHWAANRQKHTNHRKVHTPRTRTETQMHKHNTLIDMIVFAAWNVPGWDPCQLPWKKHWKGQKQQSQGSPVAVCIIGRNFLSAAAVFPWRMDDCELCHVQLTSVFNFMKICDVTQPSSTRLLTARNYEYIMLSPENRQWSVPHNARGCAWKGSHSN